MATRKTTKAKRKPVRKTRAQVRSIDEMHYGLEPSADYFENKTWHDFFGWYNYMYDRKKSNQVIISYAKKFKYKNAPKFSKMYIPGTLASFIRGIENGVKFPEIGTNNKGEIKYLSDIAKPDLGVITNISESHLINFHNMDRVYKEKIE